MVQNVYHTTTSDGMWLRTCALQLQSLLMKSEQITLTSMQLFACCRGLRKNVPSTSGYLSNTSSCSSQRTQCTLERPCDANVDRMKQRVSSFPWLPSSSVCNRTNILCFDRHVNVYFWGWGADVISAADQTLANEVYTVRAAKGLSLANPITK